MQKVTILEDLEPTAMTEVFCDSWNSWWDGEFLNFLFLDVQAAGSFEARRTVRYMSRVIISVTSERIGEDG